MLQTLKVRVHTPTIPEDVSPSFFDDYRLEYPTMNHTRKQECNRYFYETWPIQNTFMFDYDFILDSLATANPESVVELGGYEGQLALESFTRVKTLTHWINLELIPHRQVQGLEKYWYRETVLENQVWLTSHKLDCDMFVATHMLEHLSNMECTLLLEWLLQQNVKWLLLVVPTTPKGRLWTGYMGAHVLTYGSDVIKEKLNEKYNLYFERRYEDRVNKDGGWCSLWCKR